jgi:pantetheine-phosphate adenylyltransferase
MKKTVLYPGSFDPVTHGHVDIILRLRKIFDEVLVLVANSQRKNYLFTISERVQLLQEIFTDHSGVRVKSSDQLTVSVAKHEGISTIARSVRTVSDWEYEYAMADANRKLEPHIETLFMMADPQYAFISSTLVREIAAYNGDTAPFVPSHVVKALKMKGSK